MYERRIRRTGRERIHDILLVLSKGTYKKTHIMYQTNTSWQSLCKIIDKLVEQGHVIETTHTTTGRKKTKRQAYKITDKGRHLLKELIKIQEELEGLT